MLSGLLPSTQTNYSSTVLASMALGRVIKALLFTFAALACVEPSTSDVVKGRVSCPDCDRHDDLSGIKVLVKCNKQKKLAMATTDEDGSFEAELPADTSASLSNCLAKLLGGPKQLCSSHKDQVSTIVKAHEHNSFTTSTPLSFSTSCPSKSKIPSTTMSSRGDANGATATPEFGASNIAGLPDLPDLPLPSEWGLAPSSYYLPYLPIIGIP